ncbi:nitroreductase family protein [bacterium]|nr:nitroreductase family protein [bacterium]
MTKATEIFEKVPSFDYSESASDTDPQAFETVVRSRRSTRVYTDESVPEEVMRRCLELTLLAPNSSNLQPWEFYWVRDVAKKAELARLCLGQPAASTAPELIVCVARLDTWNRNRKLVLEEMECSEREVPESALKYYRTLAPLAYGQGPLGIFGPVKKLFFWLLALRKPMPRGPSGNADMRVWAHKSTALGCQNLMLSLRAFGYDSCPMEGLDTTRVRKLLGLPRTAEVCMVISAGKRAENGIYGEQVRFDPSLFLFEV